MPRSGLPQVAETTCTCVGSVLTPHDHIANVRKRLGNRVWGGWRTVSVLRFPSWTHSWKTHKPAAASQSRSADIFTIILSLECGLGCLRGLLHCSGSPRGMLHRRHLVVNFHITEMKSEELRQQGIQYRPLVCTADIRPHPIVTRTLQYAADIVSSRNGQHLFGEITPIAGGSMKIRIAFPTTEGQPWLARSCQTVQREQSGSSQALWTEVSATGDMSRPVTTTSLTLRLTQQCGTTTTLSL